MGCEVTSSHNSRCPVASQAKITLTVQIEAARILLRGAGSQVSAPTTARIVNSTFFCSAKDSDPRNHSCIVPDSLWELHVFAPSGTTFPCRIASAEETRPLINSQKVPNPGSSWDSGRNVFRRRVDGWRVFFQPFCGRLTVGGPAFARHFPGSETGGGRWHCSGQRKPAKNDLLRNSGHAFPFADAGHRFPLAGQ